MFCRFDCAIEPMLGNMRELRMHSPNVSWRNSQHHAGPSADRRADNVPVPIFRPRVVCSRIGIVADGAPPNCKQQPPR
jgi:hypothetical protein